MRPRHFLALICTCLLPTTGRAQPIATSVSPPGPDAVAAEESPVGAETQRPSEGSRIEAKREYDKQFARARELLIAERDESAARAFEHLIIIAPTAEDRRVASEFAQLSQARMQARRRRAPMPHLRTTDEMSVLYTTAFTYGFGTSAWVALQLQPKSFAAAVLPFVAITTASVGGVALIDDYRPFRLGVPQAISAGLSVGFLEGVWLVGYQHAAATEAGSQPWKASTISTILWSGATVGGITGGLVGALTEPTPGQTSLTSSAGLWGGIGAALFAAALQSDESKRGVTAFAAGAIGYNVGLIGGLVSTSYVRPSVARVRLINLGGLAGGLVALGGYLLFAEDEAALRGGLLSSGVGGLTGLGLTWWATQHMEVEPQAREQSGLLSKLVPTISPVERGAVGAVSLAF